MLNMKVCKIFIEIELFSNVSETKHKATNDKLT